MYLFITIDVHLCERPEDVSFVRTAGKCSSVRTTGRYSFLLRTLWRSGEFLAVSANTLLVCAKLLRVYENFFQVCLTLLDRPLQKIRFAYEI